MQLSSLVSKLIPISFRREARGCKSLNIPKAEAKHPHVKQVEDAQCVGVIVLDTRKAPGKHSFQAGPA